MADPRHRLVLLAVVAVLVCALFLAVNLTGKLSYILSYRAQVIATMILVGTATGVSTVLFQTITGNRILTPSVMGAEALFVLIQTSIIFFIGSTRWDSVPVVGRFAIETSVMVVFALTLYRWLLVGKSEDLYRLLLAGLVFGILFRSAAELLQRMMAPNEFNILQGRLFAQLTLPESRLLGIAGGLVALCVALLWRYRRDFDVIALGRDVAIGLGVDYPRIVTRALVLITVLISTSTALIGPLTFLGFMTATLAYQLAGSQRHALLLPFSALLGVVFLAGGQLVLEHLFAMTGTLSVVIEFTGGALFLLMLLRKGRL